MESETIDASIVEEEVIEEDYFIDNDEIEKEEVTTEEEESWFPLMIAWPPMIWFDGVLICQASIMARGEKCQ